MNKFILPLKPTDLVSIYKLEESDRRILVDYNKSREKLSADQILIYLSNIGLPCDFDSIDSELIKSYIQMDFLVNSRSMPRVIADIIKFRLGGEVKLFSGLYSPDDILSFLEENLDLIDDLINTIRGAPAFILHSIKNTKGNEVKMENKIGLNILPIMFSGIDAVLEIIIKNGISEDINIEVYNKDSKYSGMDLYKGMCDKGVTHVLLSLMPKESWKE